MKVLLPITITIIGIYNKFKGPNLDNEKWSEFRLELIKFYGLGVGLWYAL